MDIQNINAYKGQRVIIKCGGETLENPEALVNVLDQLVFLASHGVQLALVHGGGSQIKLCAEQRGIPESKVNGVRVTCIDTLDVVEEVMSGLNQELVTQLLDRINNAGLRSNIAVRGFGAYEFIEAVQQTDYGYVGEPSMVHAEYLMNSFEAGEIAIIHPLCQDETGQKLNVNADSVAGAIGRAVQAKRVVFCTSVTGVLDQDKKRIHTLTPAIIDNLVDEGTIEGGMVKKVRECEALLGHVDGVSIVGSAQTNSILDALAGTCAGTLITSI